MPTYHKNLNTVDDFGPGNAVKYVPIWVNGDQCNRDCENGVVMDTDKKDVFVRYYDNETGYLDDEARPTNPKDLINMSES